MNREQMRPLNTNDGWENIVNSNAMQRASARERIAMKKRERKLKKLWLYACAMATIGITSLILGIAGAVAGWLATGVTVVACVAASFLLGQYVEVKKG